MKVVHDHDHDLDPGLKIKLKKIRSQYVANEIEKRDGMFTASR